MSNKPLTVNFPTTTDEFMESALSPIDECVATYQLESQLPQAHRCRRFGSRFWQLTDALPLYRGRLNWCGIDFLYVVLDDNLHILEFCHSSAADGDQVQIDVLLDHPEPGSIPFLVDAGLDTAT